MYGKRCLTCIGETEKNEMFNSIMKSRVVFVKLRLEGFFFFFFEKITALYVACYVIYSCWKTFKQQFTDVFHNVCL